MGSNIWLVIGLEMRKEYHLTTEQATDKMNPFCFTAER